MHNIKPLMIKYSHVVLSKIHIVLVHQFQSIVNLDIELEVRNQFYMEKYRKNESDILGIDYLNNLLRDSYLWVLGLYELTRTICCKLKIMGSQNDILKDYNEFKTYIARLRIPLAKLEPSHKYCEEDYFIAWPVINIDKGIGWKLSENTIIMRSDISVKHYELINKIMGSEQAAGAVK